MDVDRRVAQLAARQHAVISVRQCEELGLSRGMRSRRVARGLLVPAQPGVLRIAGSPVTFHSKVLTAVLAAGDGTVATHRTAAALWGLDGFRAGVIEVAHPRGRWHRPTGVIVHQSSDLDRCTVRCVDGIPVTDPSRTILDLARRTSDARLFAAMESARRKKIASWEQLVSTLLRHARQGRPGIERTRRVITAHIEEADVTDSMFEAMVLALFAEHDLPVPVLHHRIVRSDGSFVAEVDLAYPSRLIAIELDGEVHREREVFHRDRPRQNELELLGWLVLRFTWRQLVEQPELIVRQVREALARRPSSILGD